jgi:hyperosmotically inducible protein
LTVSAAVVGGKGIAMKTMNPFALFGASFTALLTVALTLAACDKREDDTTVGQKVDKALASAQTAAQDAKQSAKKGLDEAARVSKETTDQVAQSVSDMAITAAIKADLAKDKELSALRINVDTKSGHVSLDGYAPNATARERAQAIAVSEKGVTGVDNRLAIDTR